LASKNRRYKIQSTHKEQQDTGKTTDIHQEENAERNQIPVGQFLFAKIVVKILVKIYEAILEDESKDII